ncbi:cobalt-precorrin-5B (C(1))-methyltransferase [Massilibacterium senegalense]|uniref:cobalt-precorrin-5B (C(1))-methyltransferase n=1 Tax=Massilibacterium senegalense TaxID=1632858 RepID=UPI00093B65EF|nr:cobalt-precorrin-5B (C(1))-methyltransferase [Massilibacterium senegalense]
MKSKEQKDPKEMRSGYTTGACATAATKAALTALITKKVQTESTITLPVGKTVTFTLEECVVTDSFAYAKVIKDAGDDPDATHGATIISTVRFVDSDDILLDGGFGVGRVTKPGLPVPVGQAAINPVPRKMLRNIVKEVLEQNQINQGVSVKISVPEGVEMAEKTLNGRLGILNGISILGTRGIVVPFSTAAYRASIVQAIKVAKENGCDHIVLSTGGRSEKFAMELYPELHEEAFVEMGDFVGFAVKSCRVQGIKKISISGMMGKFSKVAQGVMMVHSKSAPVDFHFLASLAEKAGADQELLTKIVEANTASQVATLMEEANLPTFFNIVSEACSNACIAHAGDGIAVETIITTLKGKLLGRKVVHG